MQINIKFYQSRIFNNYVQLEKYIKKKNKERKQDWANTTWIWLRTGRAALRLATKTNLAHNCTFQVVLKYVKKPIYN